MFNQTRQYYRRLKESGEVESFEPIQLEPHGGGLAGMHIVRGDRDKLNRLRSSHPSAPANWSHDKGSAGHGQVHQVNHLSR